MGRNYTKSDAILEKKKAFKQLNSLLEHLISIADNESYKKAINIEKWLSTYSEYISFESRFDPRRILSYKRGDVIKVNFGFRVGSELGGVHYAVVIDNHSKHSSDSITVVPLGSDKGKDNVCDVKLGDELYKKVQLKYKTLSPKVQSNKQLLNVLESVVDNEDSESLETSYENLSRDELVKVKETLKSNLENDEKSLSMLVKERDRMKSGSIAKVGQITTISKIRIIDPKKTLDVLSGIRLSEDAMSAINTKIQELFLFSNQED